MAVMAASAVGFVATFAIAAAPAEAVCYGRGDGATLTRTYNGHVVAVERQASGTCDGDNIYNGQLRDPYTDGYSARARYNDQGYNAIVAYASSNTWVDYRFYDQDGNSFAEIQIYSSPASRPSYYINTWGY